jgi:hypothetical protein
MADWYFDSVSGNDANGGHSASDAKASYSAFSAGTAAAGDRLLFKRGTTQTITAANKSVRSGSSDTIRTKYGAYGEAAVPYSIWKYGAAAGNMILNAARGSYIDFEDMSFEMAGTDCRNGIYLATQSAFTSVGITIRRCFFSGSNNAGTGCGAGLTVAREPTATVWPTDFTIEDCEFFDNNSHGLFLKGAERIAVRRCKFYRNGGSCSTGGHGFSMGAMYTSVTSGWTNTTGTIYSRTLGTPELSVYYVNATASLTYQRIRQTTGTQSAPAAGEFGVSGTTLYLNINANCNGQTIVYIWGKCSSVLVEDCEAYDNIFDVSAAFHEGHGFAADDYSDDSIFRRNIAYTNEGAAFSNNRGDRNQYIANIGYNNDYGGLIVNACDDLKIYHNTLYNNNTGASHYLGEIGSTGFGKNWVISNNILLSTTTYGVSKETTDTTFTGSCNCISGYSSSAEKGTAMLTGTVNTAPLLDADHRPAAALLNRTGTALGYKDFNGKHFYDPPNIGAVDDVSETPRFILRTS